MDRLVLTKFWYVFHLAVAIVDNFNTYYPLYVFLFTLGVVVLFSDFRSLAFMWFCEANRTMSRLKYILWGCLAVKTLLPLYK